MSVLEPTVTLEMVQGYPAVKMTWQREVDFDDLQIAFRQVAGIMDRAGGPVHVVVDMSARSRFPLLASIESAMTGPARHDNMGAWVVVGADDQARVFAKTLMDMLRGAAVHFVPDVAQLPDCLDNLRDNPN